MDAKAHVIETEKFINEIKKRFLIWDVSCEDYTNKAKKQDAWAELCREMFEEYNKFDKDKKIKTCKYLQKKWKNIRNCYTRELRRKKFSNSLSETTHKKYIYFDCLHFLQPHIQNSSLNADEDGNDAPENHREKRKKKKKKTEKNNHTNYTFPVQTHVPDPIQYSNDEDRMFLLSLVSDLKNIHHERKLLAKLEIMSVILKFRSDFPNHSNNYPTAMYHSYSNNGSPPHVEPSKSSRSPTHSESLPQPFPQKEQNSNSAFTSSTPTSSTPSEISSDTE